MSSNKTVLSSINDNVVTVCHKLPIKKFNTSGTDLLTVVSEWKGAIISEIKKQLNRLNGVKWYIAVLARFSKFVNSEEVVTKPTFHGRTRALLKGGNVEEQYTKSVNKIMENMAKYAQDGSGWTLDSIERMDLCVVKYKPLVAASYIPTPKSIAHPRKGIVNIKNSDEKCFLWSVLASLFPTRHNRVSYFKKYETLVNMSGIAYPVQIDDLDQFEQQNLSISLNVFDYENEKLCPLRVTKCKGRQHHINLLLLSNSEGNAHYCLINNLSHLLAHLTKHKAAAYYCNYCLHRFSDAGVLERHVPVCTPTNILSPSLYSTPSTSSYIPTPKQVSNPTKSVINVKNLNDNKCFLWSVLSALHEDVHRHYRVEFYKQFENEINMTDIEYPVSIKDLDRFEKQNPTLSINIFGYENDEVYPIRITTEKHRTTHINLLLLSNAQGKIHYCLISNLSRLLAHLTKHDKATYYCNYCLHRFSSEKLLLEHHPLCTPHGAQKTRLPSEAEKWMYFKNYTLTHKVPFTIYCDFEAFNEPINSCENTTNTHNIAKHIPSGFCYVIVDSEGKAIKPPVVYSGANVIDVFLNNLLDESKVLLPTIHKNVPINMTDEDINNLNNALTCHLCNKQLDGDKVANHNHLNGKYLGAAHNSCNLNYQVPTHIPVFFHNLRGYDCHHLMQGFGKFKKEKLSCIATTSEQYISVSLESLRFLDSLQFLNTSLDNLVSNLVVEGSSKFSILRQCMGDSHLDVLLRKGVYPYDYMTDESKFTDTQLPPIDKFYNKLTDTPISNEDYTHAQLVWTAFNMSNMKDYHDLYLLTDVLLLADVFENFRTTSMTYYGIDPCNMYSSPGLAWNAMLKMTDVKLELLTDIDQHLFIESGIRGGVAMIPNRYAKSNNPLLPDYDETIPANYLLYLDCTNLYGTAMTQPLPYSDFRWLSHDEISNLIIPDIDDTNEWGFILEVDLQYPEYLHDLHSDYPLAPERGVVTNEMLSPYCKHIQSKLNLSQTKTEKLLTTLNDKRKYVLHYRNLKLYLELGLILSKVHRVLTFKQSAWLKPFIEFNTEKRKLSKNSFEKDFFKLINNSTYGKSLENVRGRIDFHLVTNEKTLLKLTASPRLKNFFAYNEDLVGLAMKKQTILLNRPVYVGFTVLDLSKHIMYNFHYKWAVSKYGTNVKLCMTDTDSLFYSITTDNVYKDIKENIHLFDTSDYPSDHECYHTVNKKKLGTFKDEMNSNPPREFVGLRAKCYSALEYNEKEKKVAKGVPRVAIKKQLKHAQFKECLFNHTLKLTSALCIRSDHHQLYTQNIAKLSLSPFDDKRYVLNNGTDTLAYGHYRISQSRKRCAENNESEMLVTKRRKPIQ